VQTSRRQFHFDGRFFLMCALGIFLFPMKWLIGFFVAVIAHELAHYLALILLGAKIYRFEIGQTGILIHTEPLSNKQEFLCALAGPVGGLLFMLITYRIPYISVCACIQSVFNLLPLERFDGGRALKCLLRKYLPAETADSLFCLCETAVRILVCVFLCFSALLCANKWIRILLILVVWRIWWQKYLANRVNR